MGLAQVGHSRPNRIWPIPHLATVNWPHLAILVSEFGQFLMTEFGQTAFGQFFVLVRARKGGGPTGRGPERVGPRKGGGGRKGGAPKGWGPEFVGPRSCGAPKGWGPKFRAFFPLSRHSFLFFFPSILVFFMEFWWCFNRRCAQMCAFGVLGLSCETPAAPPDWAAGASHDNRRIPNAHILGFRPEILGGPGRRSWGKGGLGERAVLGVSWGEGGLRWVSGGSPVAPGGLWNPPPFSNLLPFHFH